MKYVKCVINLIEMGLVLCGVLLVLLKITGFMPCVVLSGSMEPAIQTGAVVLVNKNAADYSMGDVITYEIDEHLITHRIVEIQNDSFQTKGDANEFPDNVWVEKDRIIGKAELSIPVLGYVISYLQSKKTILFFVTVLLISIFLDVLSESDSQKTNLKNQEGRSVQGAHSKRI